MPRHSDFPIPLLSVIIVTFNTRDLTRECLRTLTREIQGIDAEIFLVDNASTDGTAAATRAEFPQVLCIVNEKNRGFGAANNQAFVRAAGEYILLLNSDAFPQPGAIATLLTELQAQPHAGLIGPRLLNPDGTLQLSCFRFPSPGRAWLENTWLAALFPNTRLGDYRRWPHDEPRLVDWIVGACILLRRAVYEQVGGFDENFFMYAEETDWQLRIRMAGWKIAFTPRAQVTHLAGASAGGGSANATLINPAFFNSLDYYVRKNHGIPGLISLRLAMIVGCKLRLFLWLAACIIPSRSKLARQKVRLNFWLIWRQLLTPPPALPPTPSIAKNPS